MLLVSDLIFEFELLSSRLLIVGNLEMFFVKVFGELLGDFFVVGLLFVIFIVLMEVLSLEFECLRWVNVWLLIGLVGKNLEFVVLLRDLLFKYLVSDMS